MSRLTRTMDEPRDEPEDEPKARSRNQCHCTLLVFRACGHKQLLQSPVCEQVRNTHTPENVLYWDEDCFQVSKVQDFVLAVCELSDSNANSHVSNEIRTKALRVSSQRVFLPNADGTAAVPSLSLNKPDTCSAEDTCGKSICNKITCHIFCDSHAPEFAVMPVTRQIDALAQYSKGTSPASKRRHSAASALKPEKFKHVRFMLPYSGEMKWCTPSAPVSELDNYQEVHEESTIVYNRYVRGQVEEAEREHLARAQEALTRTEISIKCIDEFSKKSVGQNWQMIARLAASRGDLFQDRREQRAAVRDATARLKPFDDQFKTVKDGRAYAKICISMASEARFCLNTVQQMPNNRG